MGCAYGTPRSPAVVTPGLHAPATSPDVTLGAQASLLQEHRSEPPTSSVPAVAAMSEGRTPAAAVAPPDHGVSDYMVDMFNITVGRQIGVGTSKSVFEGTRSNGEKIAVLPKRPCYFTG